MCSIAVINLPNYAIFFSSVSNMLNLISSLLSLVSNILNLVSKLLSLVSNIPNLVSKLLNLVSNSILSLTCSIFHVEVLFRQHIFIRKLWLDKRLKKMCNVKMLTYACGMTAIGLSQDRQWNLCISCL